MVKRAAAVLTLALVVITLAEAASPSGVRIAGNQIQIETATLSAVFERGVRCALCWNEETARLARMHNDANAISIGERMISEELALRIVDVWLTTPFEGGRHVRRIEAIDEW